MLTTLPLDIGHIRDILQLCLPPFGQLYKIQKQTLEKNKGYVFNIERAGRMNLEGRPLAQLRIKC